MKFSSLDITALKSKLVSSGMATYEDALFNPSFIEEQSGTLVVSLRKVSATKEQTRSQLIFRVFDIGTEGVHVEKIREVVELGKHKVRDMKLFKNYDTEEIFATFNTGHELRGNQILIAKLSDLDNPYILKFGARRRIEKNWGFFWQGEDLFALYSVFPLTILRQIKNENEFQTIPMEIAKSFSHKRYLRRLISIGSQPIKIGSELMLTIHLKPKILFWRAYIPLIAKINTNTGEVTVIKITFGTHVLSFQPSSLNPRALFVNYASGLVVLKDRLILGLGHKDKTFSISVEI